MRQTCFVNRSWVEVLDPKSRTTSAAYDRNQEIHLRHSAPRITVCHLLVEPTPLTGQEPNSCIDVSSEHTPNNNPSRRDSFNTDYNDLNTTVAASETPDTKEVGQSTSPLLFQERKVSSNPFSVSGFQQQASASGSRQQTSPMYDKPVANRRFVGHQETGAKY